MELRFLAPWRPAPRVGAALRKVGLYRAHRSLPATRLAREHPQKIRHPRHPLDPARLALDSTKAERLSFVAGCAKRQTPSF